MTEDEKALPAITETDTEGEEREKRNNQFTKGAISTISVRKAQAFVLLEEGKGPTEISRMVDLSIPTIRKVARMGLDGISVSQRMLDQLRKARATDTEFLQASILDHLNSPEGQAKIQAATLRDNIAALTATDNINRLNAGKATHKIDLSISDEDLRDEASRIDMELKGIFKDMNLRDEIADAEEADVETGSPE